MSLAPFARNEGAPPQIPVSHRRTCLKSDCARGILDWRQIGAIMIPGNLRRAGRVIRFGHRIRGSKSILEDISKTGVLSVSTARLHKESRTYNERTRK